MIFSFIKLLFLNSRFTQILLYYKLLLYNSHERRSTPTGMNQKLPPLSLFSALIVGGAHSGWSLAGIFMKERIKTYFSLKFNPI